MMLPLLVMSVGCEQFKSVGDIEEVVSLSVDVSTSFANPSGAPVPTKYSIKLNNFTEGYEVSGETDSDGKIKADNVIPGIYTVSAFAEVQESGFTFIYSGSLTNVEILEGVDKLDLDIVVARSGNIIMKEMYYCGSKTTSGGSYFRDQFYELYNNSNTVQYLDNLCFGTLYPSTSTTNLPDWGIENADDYVYFDKIFRLAGDGDDYPLQPGESIIIAQNADNHQRAELNPNSPVNLLSAEFEAFIRSSTIIRDNPAINMEISFWPGYVMPQWLATVFGAAYGMFYADENYDPTTTISPVGSTSEYYQVHVDDIVDAVEFVQSETYITRKRLPASVDAGATTVNGTYQAKSVHRKIKETLPDGRIIYQDINNSTSDFEVMDTPMIRRNGAKIPSWNTWAN